MKKLLFVSLLGTFTSLICCHDALASCPAVSSISYDKNKLLYIGKDDFGGMWQGLSIPDTQVIQFNGATAHDVDSNTASSIVCRYILKTGNGLLMESQNSANGFDLVTTDSRWWQSSLNLYECSPVTDSKECPFVPG